MIRKKIVHQITDISPLCCKQYFIKHYCWLILIGKLLATEWATGIKKKFILVDVIRANKKNNACMILKQLEYIIQWMYNILYNN